MGVITDILTGVPLNAVLRERLVDKEAYIATLEAENMAFKAKIAVLEAENADFKTKFQKIESDKAVHGDICPYCQQPNGKLLDIKPDAVWGDMGVKIFYYQCENCGKKYDKEQSRQ